MTDKLQTGQRVFILLWLLTLIPGLMVAQELANYNNDKGRGDITSQDKNMQSLKSVFSELEREFQIKFAFENDLVKGKYVDINQLTIENKNANELEKSLKKVLTPLELQLTRVEGYFVVKPLGEAKTKEELNLLNREGSFNHDFLKKTNSGGNGKQKTQISRVLTSKINKMNELFQEREITGTVTTAEDDSPLPGVNVVVQGTSIGTVTDVNGNYSINVPTDANVLVFSFTGYTNEEVTIGNQSTIDVVMAQSLQQLQEVLVVGYGTQEKKDMTGSVSAVSSEDFNKQPVTRLDQILQGRTPGVNVTQSSGAPGGDVSIRVRGSNSITGSNDPLYVVDGFGGRISGI